MMKNDSYVSVVADEERNDEQESEFRGLLGLSAANPTSRPQRGSCRRPPCLGPACSSRPAMRWAMRGAIAAAGTQAETGRFLHARLRALNALGPWPLAPSAHAGSPALKRVASLRKHCGWLG
jgi:hypothetical protein